MFFIKQTLITKEEKLKQNRKMKLLVQHLKYMLRKELEMQGMLVEKHLFLLEVVLLNAFFQIKTKYLIRQEKPLIYPV